MFAIYHLTMRFCLDNNSIKWKQHNMFLTFRLVLQQLFYYCLKNTIFPWTWVKAAYYSYQFLNNIFHFFHYFWTTRYLYPRKKIHILAQRIQFNWASVVEACRVTEMFFHWNYHANCSNDKCLANETVVIYIRIIEIYFMYYV